MNLYVDGMYFRKSGIGRIYENLLRALLEEDWVGRISTIVPASRKAHFLAAFSSPRLDVLFVPYEEGSWQDYTIKAGHIRRFRPGPDLYCFPNCYVPFFLKGKIVTTILDIIPLYASFDLPQWKKRVIRLLMERSIGKSDRCVCISGFTRDEVLREFGCGAGKMEVIHPWIDDTYVGKEVAGGKEVSHLVEGDYLLFVGNRYPHKNLKTIIEALRLLKEGFPNLKLVVAGARVKIRDDVDAAVRDPGLSGRVIGMESLSDGQIKNLYRHARVLVFPSLVEGFGLPPLEAMSLGTPVVCSDIPVLREVCGDAVIYADPRDPGSFASAIREFLSDPEGSWRYKALGNQRVKEYEKNRAVGRYKALFEEILGYQDME